MKKKNHFKVDFFYWSSFWMNNYVLTPSCYITYTFEFPFFFLLNRVSVCVCWFSPRVYDFNKLQFRYCHKKTCVHSKIVFTRCNAMEMFQLNISRYLYVMCTLCILNYCLVRVLYTPIYIYIYIPKYIYLDRLLGVSRGQRFIEKINIRIWTCDRYGSPEGLWRHTLPFGLGRPPSCLRVIRRYRN